jgi:hypothetical protein
MHEIEFRLVVAVQFSFFFLFFAKKNPSSYDTVCAKLLYSSITANAGRQRLLLFSPRDRIYKMISRALVSKVLTPP